MPTARILIKQADKVYRFMRFEASSDGSLIALLDMDRKPNLGSASLDQSGIFVSDEKISDQEYTSTKLSIHTTGEVHRYLGGLRKGTIYIEPLYALTGLTLLGFESIPRLSRLDVLDEREDRHDVAATLEFPENVASRVSFLIEIGPNPQRPKTFGVTLGYELYSVVVRVNDPPFDIPHGMEEYFFHAMPSVGIFEERQIDEASAELAFYQAAYPQQHVFREEGGAYVVLAGASMRVPPKLIVAFNRDDLFIEQIPSTKKRKRNHKVRFWICDRGGRNKRDDLRSNIVSIQLDANREVYTPRVCVTLNP